MKSDNDVLLVLVTVPDRNCAERLADDLVQHHLAACVNVIPALTSIYRWKGKVHRDDELLLLIKTHRRILHPLQAAVLRQHPYECPELIAVPVVGGYEGYLEWVAAETVGTAPPAGAYQDFPPHPAVDQVKSEEKTMIQVGTRAPDFSMEAVMPDGTRKTVRLSDYRGKWLVLFFYPLDFTFVCPTEITGFSHRIEDFRRLNAEVIGASTDSVHSHMAWVKGDLGKINFPLASDITRTVSRDYGVLLEDKGYALRGAFIIDPNGELKWHLVHDTNVGRSVEETLRVLEALQTGELCPADWKHGMKTLGKK